MVVVNVEGKEFYLDGYLKQNLDDAFEMVRTDNDFVCIVDGRERSGKSSIALQMAFYLDKSFSLDRVCFSAKEFEKAVLNASQYSAVVYDESFTGMASSSVLSLVNRSLIKLMAEIGQKNLFIFVVMPSFFDLSKYIALHRSQCLIHVYTGKNFKRGFFTFYNEDKKKFLYIAGKKFYNYNVPKANFYGCFTKFIPFEEADYRKKKHNSLMVRDKDKVDVSSDKDFQKKLFKRFMDNPDLDITNDVKSILLGVASNTFYVWVREYNCND